MSSSMRLIRRLARPPADLSAGCVATIGTFDGVHRGHQEILGRVLREAQSLSLPAVVFSFEPTPREYFSHSEPPARLTRFREKFTVLQSLGFDWFLCPPFDAELESLSPDAFMDRFLIELLRIKHLVVGDDFRFARQRAGTVDDLRRCGAANGFRVDQVASVTAENQRVSSTLIRQALADGRMDLARALLGRHYRMAGRVVRGKQLGKQLGFPTANVELHRRASPVAGIFAVRVAGLEDALLDGVASVGTRPTVDGGRLLLEVHIFDFDRQIYGEHIEVEFVAKLRDEVRFDDLESLTEQMRIDASQAREILANTQAG